MLYSEAMKSLEYYKMDEPYINVDVFCFNTVPYKTLCPSTVHFNDFEVKEISVDFKVTELYAVSEGSCIVDYEFFICNGKLSVLIGGWLYFVKKDRLVKSNKNIDISDFYLMVEVLAKEIE